MASLIARQQKDAPAKKTPEGGEKPKREIIRDERTGKAFEAIPWDEYLAEERKAGRDTSRAEAIAQEALLHHPLPPGFLNEKGRAKVQARIEEWSKAKESAKTL